MHQKYSCFADQKQNLIIWETVVSAGRTYLLLEEQSSQLLLPQYHGVPRSTKMIMKYHRLRACCETEKEKREKKFFF